MSLLDFKSSFPAKSGKVGSIPTRLRQFYKMNAWIGTDESGKGDYFGSLVIAGVMVDETIASKLKSIGVKDSKRLSDSRVKSLSEDIQKLCPCDIVTISPPKYIELYSKLHNLNRLLAWGHARVIENLLSGVGQGTHTYPGINRCDTVIADKFGDKGYIEKALMTKGKQITLIQRPKAEDDIAVAAASIVARNGFIDEIAALSTQIGVQLPKGAGTQVEDIAQYLVQKYGKEILNQVAKLHFKTSNKIIHSEQNNDEPTKDEPPKPKLERLWAPWRAEYIYSSKSDNCIFCQAIAKEDTDAFILSRGTKGFVIMNTFPYNNGHIMVAPYRHIANVEDLIEGEILSLFDLVQKSVRVLKIKMRPDGFNIGINLGKVAGAGVEGHIHIHIVPRWNGDTNFMPIVAETKVISQSLEEAYKLLKEGFGEVKNDKG